jgi:broad specificity phosphatase PhoE
VDFSRSAIADFFQSRRSINDYLKDLSKNIISYRKYQFFKNKYKIIKKTKKINNKNKIIFYNHIVKNLICNYFKFFYQKNIKFNHLSEKNIIKAFGKDFFNQNYKNIIKLDIVYKKKKLNNFNIWNFIKNYHKFLKEIKKNSSTIVLIRHKKTKFKKSIFISNKINPSILEKKKRNSLKKVDYIFSSPMKRCLETAKQYFKSDYKITIDNNLREINYGKAEGLDLKQIKNKFPEIILSWRRGYDPRFPGGENTKDVFNRVKNFNRKIFKIDNKKIGVVSHNNFIRCFIGLVFKLNLNKLYKIYVPYFNKISFIIIQNRILLNTNRTNIYRILKKY